MPRWMNGFGPHSCAPYTTTSACADRAVAVVQRAGRVAPAAADGPGRLQPGLPRHRRCFRPRQVRSVQPLPVVMSAFSTCSPAAWRAQPPPSSRTPAGTHQTADLLLDCQRAAWHHLASCARFRATCGCRRHLRPCQACVIIVQPFAGLKNYSDLHRFLCICYHVPNKVAAGLCSVPDDYTPDAEADHQVVEVKKKVHCLKPKAYSRCAWPQCPACATSLGMAVARQQMPLCVWWLTPHARS
jgi:hypothetical protein